ncbi:hypothetical protein HKK55_08095 [Pseudomonas sp. ADAK18]|uniref:hypothetical protein n=1 Tax=Pseudomonas sp. ADAK18 TaxID=2730848 RepID=UPI0014637784|nr:hypothetical protein [Pseudomonas sp. ADAK18]QJI28679.1 hypothetical protein HKK55_08095 [Pseudomonas sp. ADAK18]
MSYYWKEVADLGNRVEVSSKNLAEYLRINPEPWRVADLERFAALHVELLDAQIAYVSFQHTKLA